MDDAIILTQTKEEAKTILEKIKKFLKIKLELELNNKTQIFKSKQGVNFCGYKINEYRIVGIEDGKIKLNKNDYIKSGTTTLSNKLSTNATYGSGDSDDYWDYYLNNTWYNSLASNSMLDKGTYYIKVMSSDFYKNFLCNTNNTTETTKDCVKTTSIWNSGYVGLPRYGEMFASQQGNGSNSSSIIWLITPYSSSNVWHVNGHGYANRSSPSNAYGVRPSINLKSNIVITGGSGTKSNPFTITLKD